VRERRAHTTCKTTGANWASVLTDIDDGGDRLRNERNQQRQKKFGEENAHAKISTFRAVNPSRTSSSKLVGDAHDLGQ